MLLIAALDPGFDPSDTSDDVRIGFKGVFGSLTLGGVDAARFVPNDVSFDLATDISRDLVVGLQSIKSIESNGSTSWLLPSAHLTFIDSTIPYIYLPLNACEIFEDVLGLVWNSTYEMYLVDDALHRSLLTRDPTFTFTIANSLTGGPTVDIILPYSSFDLSYLPSFDTPTLRYFPIQRADNDTQLTLGRAFLQEAYVTTDYQRGNFSVSQCNFEESLGPSIVPINPKGSRISTTSPQGGPTVTPNAKQHGSPLTHQQLAAIIFGAITGTLLLLTILYWLYRRQSFRRCEKQKATALLASTKIVEQSPKPLQFLEKPCELEPVLSLPEMEANYPHMIQEVSGTGRAELQGRGRSLDLLRSIRTLTPISHSRPRSSIAVLRRDRRRHGKHVPDSGLLSSGNILRYLARLDGLQESRSASPANRESVSTIAQLKELYLDRSFPEASQNPSPTRHGTPSATVRPSHSDLNRSLPPTPISESPQRISYLAWMRIGARYNDEQIQREPQDFHRPEMSQWKRTTPNQMGWF